jgi:hypothetical protein
MTRRRIFLAILFSIAFTGLYTIELVRVFQGESYLHLFWASLAGLMLLTELIDLRYVMYRKVRDGRSFMKIRKRIKRS